MNQNEESSGWVVLKLTKFWSFLLFIREFRNSLIIFCLVGFFVALPFRISGHSMEDNFYDGEYFLMDKFSYLDFPSMFESWTVENNNFLEKFVGWLLTKIPLHIGDPKRWDVIVLKPHVTKKGAGEYYLKRIIGLPWETIRIQNGEVFIKKQNSWNFIKLNEPYLSPENANKTYLPLGTIQTDFIIPERHYWVMGDNRRFSTDSRSCFYSCNYADHSMHFIARKDIIGKFFLDFWYFEIFKENDFPKIGSLSWKYTPRWLDAPRSATYPELD